MKIVDFSPAEDGRRVALSAGQGAWFGRGEHHAKGDDHGMTALMVPRSRGLEPRPGALDEGRGGSPAGAGLPDSD